MSEKKGCLQSLAYLVIVIIGGFIILAVAIPIFFYVLLSFMHDYQNLP